MKTHCRSIGKARPATAQTTGLQLKLELLGDMMDFGFDSYEFVLDLLSVTKGHGGVS